MTYKNAMEIIMECIAFENGIDNEYDLIEFINDNGIDIEKLTDEYINEYMNR